MAATNSNQSVNAELTSVTLPPSLKKDGPVYGKGDICLNINPFDNYRLFTIYDDWRNDDRKPLNLSGDQKMYLVFKSRRKEIRIPEYDGSSGSYFVDKVNGEVLFKITKKNAMDILSMEEKTFYITRIYEIVDQYGDNEMISDEEVLYIGQWVDGSTSVAENYTSKIKSLMDTINELKASLTDLQRSNSALMIQNVEYASRIEELNASNEELNNSINSLEERLTEYESGNIYDATLIGEGTYTNIISNRQYTEEEIQNAFNALDEDGIPYGG